MTVLVAPDSFKGTYSAAEVAKAISEGITDGGGHAVQLPVADGGEETFDALCRSLRASAVSVDVVNSWGEPLRAVIGVTEEGAAVVEVAQANGLTAGRITPHDAVAASTYGTGMMIAAAVSFGAEQVLVAAGGSATTDGGAGAVDAITEAGGLRGARITVLSDVTTSFLDAPRVFGPQKGADSAAIGTLEDRLAALAQSFPRNPAGVPRTGAAGGLSGGLWAHFEADLVSGADAVLDAGGFDRCLASAEAVIVGEGRLDSQTGRRENHFRNPAAGPAFRPEDTVIAVVGSVADDLGDYAENFAGILVATDAAAMRAAGKAIAAG
jgi:glycerate kinase